MTIVSAKSMPLLDDRINELNLAVRPVTDKAFVVCLFPPNKPRNTSLKEISDAALSLNFRQNAYNPLDISVLLTEHKLVSFRDMLKNRKFGVDGAVAWIVTL